MRRKRKKIDSEKINKKKSFVVEKCFSFKTMNNFCFKKKTYPPNVDEKKRDYMILVLRLSLSL